MTTFETRPSEATPSTIGNDAAATVAGWHADPLGLHRMRYFSGSDWTEHVTHFGPTPCLGCNF